MGVAKAAIGDGVLTFMWVFCASTLGAATSVIATAIGIQGMASLLITISLIFILLFIFGIIGHALGGASFNPAGTAAFYAAGLGGDTLISAAVRFPAQYSSFLFCSSLLLLICSRTNKATRIPDSFSVLFTNQAAADLLTNQQASQQILFHEPTELELQEFVDARDGLLWSDVREAMGGNEHVGPSTRSKRECYRDDDDDDLIGDVGEEEEDLEANINEEVHVLDDVDSDAEPIDCN